VSCIIMCCKFSCTVFHAHITFMKLGHAFMRALRQLALRKVVPLRCFAVLPFYGAALMLECLQRLGLMACAMQAQV